MNVLINQIVERFSILQKQEYEQEFKMLYGLIWEFDAITDARKDEILYIEEKRISEKRDYYRGEQITPAGLVKMYSQLAFLLAKEHCKNGKIFDIALQINEYFLAFVQDDFLTKDEKQRLRKEISETQLDFKCAAGHDRFSSLRMAPYIRRTNK